MVTLNMTAMISDGKVVSYSIDPGFMHDARVSDKREYYNLRNAIDRSMKRFVGRRFVSNAEDVNNGLQAT